MILKETDKKNTSDKLTKAGYEAERQMAFYLKRAFEDNPKIFVLNDLRLVENDEVAQIDHLIIHESGFIIIESKSISTKVSVNQYGEWTRYFNHQKKGMPSPLLQAKRQAEFLQTYLNRYGLNLFKQTLINKLVKTNYDNLFFDTLIAISDNGIIERNNIDIPEVNKADVIPEKVKEIIAKHKKDILTEFIPKHTMLHQDTIKKIGYFLTIKHSSKVYSSKKEETESTEAINIKEEAPKYNKNFSKFTCKSCKSSNLEITYGKYGYYFKCIACGGNTSIKLTCNKPTCKPRLKKEKNIFYKICNDCDIKEHFYTNKI